MGKGDYLGEFEQLVLWALVRLKDNAYGMTIRREVEDRSKRKNVAIGAVYAALDRLESKGFVTARAGEATSERGGRAKRYFAITGAGVHALNDSRAMLSRMWHGLRLAQEI